MARLMARSKSHQKLREAAAESRYAAHQKTKEPVSNETARHELSPPLLGSTAQSKFASSSLGSTPSFEVLSRPKTANAAMEEARKRKLMAMGDPISVTDGKETFNFPTPVLMSRYANSPLAVRPNLERSNTPDTIGIALGSPSHLAQFESQLAREPSMQDRLCAGGSAEVTPTSTPRIPDAAEQKTEASQGSKPKISRWKSIFGRKAQPQLQSQDAVPRSGLGLTNYHNWESSSPRSPRMRSDTVPRYDASPQAPPKSPRWNLGRSQTAPTARRNVNSPPTPPKDFLAVEIPETKMERYSIMFNGVLAGQQGGGGGGLLARRLSKRENRNVDQQQPTTLEDLDIPPVPQRTNINAPSSASPSYRLLVFPPSKDTNSPSPSKSLLRKPSLLHRPRPKPLKRSNTAPGALSPGLRNKMAGPLSPMSEMSESGETDIDTAPSTGVPLSSSLTREDEAATAAAAEDAREDAERQALTPTTSEPSTPTTPEDSKPLPTAFPFSTSNEHARKSSTNLSVKTWDDGRSIEPEDWEMITIGKIAEPGDRFSGAQVRVLEEPSPIDASGPREAQWHPLRMNSLVDKSRGSAAAQRYHARQVPSSTSNASVAKPVTRQRGLSNTNTSRDLTLQNTMATQRLPTHAKDGVQIARSMSVTKATGRPALRTSPRGVERTKGENLVESQRGVVPVIVTVPAVGCATQGQGTKVGMGHKATKSCAASIVSQ